MGILAFQSLFWWIVVGDPAIGWGHPWVSYRFQSLFWWIVVGDRNIILRHFAGVLVSILVLVDRGR